MTMIKWCENWCVLSDVSQETWADSKQAPSPSLRGHFTSPYALFRAATLKHTRPMRQLYSVLPLKTANYPLLNRKISSILPFQSGWHKTSLENWQLKHQRKKKRANKTKKQPENLSGGLLLLPLSCQNKPYYLAAIMQHKAMNSNWLDLDQWLWDPRNKSGRPRKVRALMWVNV